MLPKKSDKFGKINDNVDGEVHPSQDNTNRFAVDALIRSKGYRVVVRRGDNEAVWEKGGVRLLQREVEMRLDQQELWNAEHMEYLYWEGFPK